MLSISIPKRQIYTKALSLKLPKELLVPFIEDFYKFSEKSGIDWTCDRLKSIKQDLINFKANSQKPVTPWVARNRKGMFKGYLGGLFAYAEQSTKCFKRVLSLLNLYTTFMFDVPRPNVEIKKFISAVRDKGLETPLEYHDLIRNASNRFRVVEDISSAPRLELIPYTTPSREARLMREPIRFFSTEQGIQTIIDYYDVFGDSLMGVWGFRGPRYTGEVPYIGTIHCTPNPGLKARFFASPDLWLQHVLKPLGDKIYHLVKTIPWDCTFDQFKCNNTVINQLRDNNKCYCYDLSSATDRFPFDLQLSCLRSLFPSKSCQRHIDFYQYIQSFPYKFGEEELIWERGQALGMYPSFGTFTLTHGLLLYALNNFQHNDKFFVLGDDVIILDHDLSSKYSKFLTDCDIPFSPNKTITSSVIAEFAGNVFHKDGSFRVPKWKPLNKLNVLEQIKEWNIPLINLLPKALQPKFRQIAQLPSPWGCDLNPNGLSLDDRFLGLEEIFCTEDKDLEFSTNIRSLVLSRHIEQSDLKTLVNLPGSLALAAISDQEMTDYLHRKGINIPIPNELLGKNLYSIDPDLDLPIAGLVKGEVSSQQWALSVQRFFLLMDKGDHR